MEVRLSQREQFVSRLGFVAAAVGMAVGTGNIWRFPRMAAQYGGGVFVLVYVLALLLWSAPLLMVEMAIGRKTRLGPIGGFRDFIGQKYTWMGAWMVAVCMLITFYYAVITGWCARYFVFSLQALSTRGWIRPPSGITSFTTGGRTYFSGAGHRSVRFDHLSRDTKRSGED